MNDSKLNEIALKVSGQIRKNHNSIILSVSPDRVREACGLIVNEIPELYHLTTITGVDIGNSIQVYYHFWQGNDFLSVKTEAKKDNPVLDSLSDLLPSCLLYEAEVKDLLGVIFKGNPMMDRKLLLPENYPDQAPPPLRKEADPEQIRKMMGLE